MGLLYTKSSRRNIAKNLVRSVVKCDRTCAKKHSSLWPECTQDKVSRADWWGSVFIMLYNCNLQLEEIAWKRYGSIAVCAVDWRAEITFFFYHVQPCFFHETDKALWDNWTQSQTHCGKCEPFLEPNHKSSNLDESLGSKNFC